MMVMAGPIQGIPRAWWKVPPQAAVAMNGQNITNMGNITFAAGKALQTAVAATNTLLFQAYDVDGAAYTTFITLTAANTPTMALGAVSLNGQVTLGAAFDGNGYNITGIERVAIGGGDVWASDANSRFFIYHDSDLMNGIRYGNDADGAVIHLTKTRGADRNTHGILQNNDKILWILANGSDGASFLDCADLIVEADAAWGVGDTPTRWVFLTCADGTNTRAEAMRISADKGVRIGVPGTVTGILRLGGATSGTVSLTVAAVAGTWTMTLPAAAGTAGYFLVDAAGNGVTSWSNTLPAVTLNGTVAGAAQVLSNLGMVYIGDTADANVTLGLVINQGANDNKILTLKSSDVAHGMTDLAETDTYGFFVKADATEGGLEIAGLCDVGVNALRLKGYGITDNTTKSTAGQGYFSVDTYKKSGTTVATPGADANLVTFHGGGTTRFIFDVEGSGHADVEWVAFQGHDDLALLADMETELVAHEDTAKTARRHALEALGVIGKGSWHMENGRPKAMVNFTKLAMLHHGALLQTYQRHQGHEGRIERLEQENRELKAQVQALLPAGG